MERDFLGLSDKQYLCNVKREVEDDDVGEKGLSNKGARLWGKANLLPTSDLQEAKAFTGSYQMGSVSAASVSRKSQFGGAFQNATPLLLGGSVPLTNHSSLLPIFNSSSDNTRKRVASQLTIFYDGTVSVFNDISPDKAQAIMLCAGKGLKVETGESKPLVREAIHIGATNAMSMIESFNASPGSMSPSVPQARKASLVRFLEKRKERLMSAMPYKKMFLEFSTGESSGTNYSSTSPA